jgi:hypothetical protein
LVNKSATARLGWFATGEISLEVRAYPLKSFPSPPPMAVPSQIAEDDSVPSLGDLRALALENRVQLLVRVHKGSA